MILTKTTHILLYFTANTWYNSAKTYLIHQGGCLVDEKLSLSRVNIVQHGPLTLLVEFLSYVNLHFHFTLMQKFKCWYQLEGNSIRNNFGPSVQRSFQLGGQGAPPGGATHRTYGNRCIS